MELGMSDRARYWVAAGLLALAFALDPFFSPFALFFSWPYVAGAGFVLAFKPRVALWVGVGVAAAAFLSIMGPAVWAGLELDGLAINDSSAVIQNLLLGLAMALAFTVPYVFGWGCSALVAWIERKTVEDCLTMPPADWYPDPSGVHDRRFWDGRVWTPAVVDGGSVGSDSLDAHRGGAGEQRHQPDGQ